MNCYTNKDKDYNCLKYSFFIKHKCSILFCQALGSYTLIYYNNRDEIEKTSYRLGIIQGELYPTIFYRCHNSYIVNIYYINKICKGGNKMLMSNGIEIPISRINKKGLDLILFPEFSERFNPKN